MTCVGKTDTRPCAYARTGALAALAALSRPDHILFSPGGTAAVSGRYCSFSFVLSLEDMPACSYPIHILARSALAFLAWAAQERERHTEAVSETTLCWRAGESRCGALFRLFPWHAHAW